MASYLDEMFKQIFLLIMIGYKRPWEHVKYLVWKNKQKDNSLTLLVTMEIWHIPTLNQSLKNSLRSVSAKAIKLCMKSNDHWLLSHADLHEIAGRALPERMMHYKLALQLHRTFNLQSPTQDWLGINFNSTYTSRQTKFIINKTCRLKVGINVLANRFHYLNGKLELNWLNLKYDSYKIKCKRLLLS